MVKYLWYEFNLEFRFFMVKKNSDRFEYEINLSFFLIYFIRVFGYCVEVKEFVM